MAVFDNEEYSNEAKKRWGRTAALQEYEQNTAHYTADVWRRVNDGFEAVFARFAACMVSGQAADSTEAQTLVEALQNHITETCYTCTDEILAGLGRMYVADERFRTNIDQHAIGTADFISQAIEMYCLRRHC